MPKKIERGDSLVSPGMICYAEKQVKPFWSSSLGQMVLFDTIIFCRTSKNYFGQFVWIEKKVTIIVAFHFMKRRLKRVTIIVAFHFMKRRLIISSTGIKSNKEGYQASGKSYPLQKTSKTENCEKCFSKNFSLLGKSQCRKKNEM